MLPHPEGEKESLIIALHECAHGFRDLDDACIDDDSARGWLSTIRNTYATEGIEDPSGRGTISVRVEQLSEAEILDFSRAVDELASWCRRRLHKNG